MIDENGFEIQPLYEYFELFNFVNSSKIELRVVKSLLSNYAPILKQKYLETFLDNQNSIPPQATIEFSNITSYKESDLFNFEYEFYINEYGYDEDGEVIIKKFLTEFGKHSDSVSFLKLIELATNKYNNSIIEHFTSKIENSEIDRNIVVSYQKESLNSIEVFLSKNKILERFPIILEALQTLKLKLESIDLNDYTFKSDFGTATANDNTDSEEENSISSSTSKLSWNKAPHLFYLLFSALYEKGFISNPNGKINLKAVSNLLYQSISLKQKIGNTVEEVEFNSFYQNLKSSSNLQEEPLNKDIKSLIIKCLEDIEKM